MLAGGVVVSGEIVLGIADVDLVRTFQVLTKEVVLEVRKDKRYLSVQDAWRECMRSAGSPGNGAYAPHTPVIVFCEVVGGRKRGP